MGCFQAWNSNNSYVPATQSEMHVSFPVCIDMAQESGLFVPLALGNPTTGAAPSSGNGLVATGAEAIRVTYDVSYERDDEDAEARALAWEVAFEEEMGERIDELKRTGVIPAGYEAVRLTDQSLDAALEESVGGDFLYIALTFILMTCLVSAISFSRNVVQNKALLSLAAVSATGIAIPSAFGLCSYIGIPFVSIVGVSPFLLLALGIDNGLVILASYLRTPSSLSSQRRMELMMRDAG